MPSSEVTGIHFFLSLHPLPYFARNVGSNKTAGIQAYLRFGCTPKQQVPKFHVLTYFTVFDLIMAHDPINAHWVFLCCLYYINF